MATYFPVDATQIDLVNKVFNYYLPGVTITGDQDILDQDEDTSVTISEKTYTEFSLGELTRISTIHFYGTGLFTSSSTLLVYITPDYGVSWDKITSDNVTSNDTELIATINGNITGFKIIATEENVTVYRAAAFAHSTDLVIRDENQTIITGIDFGTANLNSTTVKKIEIYSNSSSFEYDNIKIYEVKDNLNTSNTYLSFSQELSGVYTDNALNISGYLYGLSGIYVYAKLNTPTNANFGNYTSYIRVVANEYFFE